jgi:hypothetical protein
MLVPFIRSRAFTNLAFKKAIQAVFSNIRISVVWSVAGIPAYGAAPLQCENSNDNRSQTGGTKKPTRGGRLVWVRGSAALPVLPGLLAGWFAVAASAAIRRTQ